MGFERFGRKSFTSQTKVAAFVDYLDKGELRATKCNNCDQVFFPPRADCPNCLGDGMEWVEVEGTGSLVSFTQVNYAPAGFEGDVPYILSLVDFGKVRVFGRMRSDVPQEALKVGMPVKAVICRLSDGQVAYEFLPAR
ncbi:MAG: Zn-ribbon domain-containing OB-fold protein [Peptococcaceae bacterium]|nr:Zn-ribbon domain-containing OB-fold protein [Peptococcaceae bacterium]